MSEFYTLAYIDESGNADLDTDKRGVSTHFTICAIIISPDKKDKLTSDVQKLRKKYFQKGEIKSSRVGNNIRRRAKILAAVSELDFKFYALSVDKNRINKDSGLRFKKSFIKYLNGKLYSLLFKTSLDVHIVADEHGSEEFKKGFKKYIEKNHKPNIFYKSRFDLVNSKDEVLVQLADFVVGTIAKEYEKKVSSELSEVFKEFIAQKSLGIDDWPPLYQLRFPKDATTEQFSKLIYQYSIARAEIFIEENEKSNDEDRKLQIAALRNIMLTNKMIDRKAYTKTADIIQYLSEAGYGEISKYTLRSKIIAPLRDSDVIITSSNQGYKIPCDFQDMEDFVIKVNSIVSPLISRLGRARKNLKTVSKGELDILKGPNFPHLDEFIEVLDKQRRASKNISLEVQPESEPA